MGATSGGMWNLFSGEKKGMDVEIRNRRIFCLLDDTVKTKVPQRERGIWVP